MVIFLLYPKFYTDIPKFKFLDPDFHKIKIIESRIYNNFIFILKKQHYFGVKGSLELHTKELRADFYL